MAAFISRVLVSSRINVEITSESHRRNIAKLAKFLRKKKPDEIRKPGPKIYSMEQKLQSKGYLRSQKEYIPPENVDEQLDSIFSSLEMKSDGELPITDPALRFRILNECYKSFNHGVPNSLLHTMNKIGDIVEFYKTPVDIATPMDRYQTMELPPNLHIQYEYKRFNPEEDEMFGGVTAFPKSATIVSGLKAKQKYKSVPAQNWTKDWQEMSLGYIKWH